MDYSGDIKFVGMSDTTITIPVTTKEESLWNSIKHWTLPICGGILGLCLILGATTLLVINT